MTEKAAIFSNDGNRSSQGSLVKNQAETEMKGRSAPNKRGTTNEKRKSKERRNKKFIRHRKFDQNIYFKINSFKVKRT